MVMRVCRVCRTEKPIEDFYVYRKVCKSCFLARTNARHRELYAEQVAIDREGYNAGKLEQYYRRKGKRHA